MDMFMDNRVEFSLNLEEFPVGFGDNMEFNAIDDANSVNSGFATNSPGDAEIKSEGATSPSLVSADSSLEDDPKGEHFNAQDLLTWQLFQLQSQQNSQHQYECGNLPALQPQQSTQQQTMMNFEMPKNFPFISLDLRVNSSPSNSCDDSSDSNEKKPKKIHPSARNHNLVERRYRETINDQINSLKDLLPSGSQDKDSKKKDRMNKSSILKRAGDYITHLERANKTLMADNNRMKSVLVQNDIALSSGIQQSQQAGQNQTFSDYKPQQRVLMCALAFGLCTVPYFTSLNSALPHHTSVGRVLMSTDTASSNLHEAMWLMIGFASRAAFFVCCALWFLKDSSCNSMIMDSNIIPLASWQCITVAQLIVQMVRHFVLVICGSSVAMFLCGSNAAEVAVKCHNKSQKISGLAGALFSLQAVNAMYGTELISPIQRASVFVGFAIHISAMFGPKGSFLAKYFLGKARREQPTSISLPWCLRDEGQAFITSKNPTSCNPFVREVARFFCRHVLSSSLNDILKGNVSNSLNLLQIAQESASLEDKTLLQGMEMASVLVLWRLGSSAQAAAKLSRVVASQVQDVLLQAVMSALLSRQALLDEDFALCEEALTQASLKLSRCVINSDTDTSIWMLLAWRLVLSVRVARIRFLESSRELKDDIPSISELQQDLASMRPLAMDDARFSCVLNLYSGIMRSLANTRSHQTRHVFVESMKAAHRTGLVYDEALGLLQMCICLRSDMPATTLRCNLEKAINIFQQLGAVDELRDARCMLGQAASS